MDGVRFTRTADGAEVAYREIGGTGPGIVYMSSGTDPIDLQDDDPVNRRFLRGLADLGRAVTLDRRGIGQSDSVDWDRPLYAQWAEDLVAVIEELDLHDVTLVGSLEVQQFLMAAERLGPRVRRIAILSPVAGVAAGAYFDDETWRAVYDEVLARDGTDIVMEKLFPARADDAAFRAWYSRAGAVGASGKVVRQMLAQRLAETYQNDVRGMLRAAPPTLLLARPCPASQCTPESIADIASWLPDVQTVHLSGVGSMFFACDPTDVLRALSLFVTGEIRVLSERVIRGLLFTDIVDSTRLAATHGDTTWREILEQHDRIVRTVVGAHRGQVVKFTGDGVLSCFATGTHAVDAAAALAPALAPLGIKIRAGVHVGEIEEREGDIAGIAVHLAARIMSRAADGRVAVSPATVATTYGSARRYRSLGEFDLKGIPDPVEILELEGE